MHIVPVRCYKKYSFFAFRLEVIFLLRSVAAAAFGREDCLCCGRESFVLPICQECLQKFFSFSVKPEYSCRCRICGKELVSEQGLCSACREHPVLIHTDGVFPLHAYRLWKKELLFSWKIEGKRSLSPVFAAAVHKALCQIESVAGKDCPVVPVPPRPGKIKDKGWDQVDELCAFLHAGYGTTVLKLLVRLSKTQQKKLDRLQRIDKISSAYAPACARRLKRLLKDDVPESVVLVDDVMTTGSTVESCASVLKRIGIKRVFAVTLFCVD